VHVCVGGGGEEGTGNYVTESEGALPQHYALPPGRLKTRQKNEHRPRFDNTPALAGYRTTRTEAVIQQQRQQQGSRMTRRNGGGGGSVRAHASNLQGLHTRSVCVGCGVWGVGCGVWGGSRGVREDGEHRQTCQAPVNWPVAPKAQHPHHSPPEKWQTQAGATRS
jgi:hypothetical protein